MSVLSDAAAAPGDGPGWPPSQFLADGPGHQRQYWGVTTLTGNPQNIIIGPVSDLTWSAFSLLLIPIALLSLGSSPEAARKAAALLEALTTSRDFPQLPPGSRR